MAPHTGEGESVLSPAAVAELLDELPDAAYVIQLEPEVRFEFVSPAIESIVGYRPDAFISDPGLWLAVVDPRDVSGMVQAISIPINQSTDVALRFTASDGHLVWTHHRCRKRRRQDGSVALYGLARDASASQLALGDIAHAEEQLRLVLDHTADVVIRYGPDGTVLWASPSLKSVFGWDPAEVVGGPFRISPTTEREHFGDSFAEAVRDRRDSYRDSAQVVCRDGSLRWTDSVTRLVWAEDGSLAYVVASIRDVTAEVELRRELRESQQHFQMLAENASDVVIESGTDGKILWVSPSCESVLGWQPDQLIGHRVSEYMHKGDLRDLKDLRVTLLASPETDSRIEARFSTADGGWRWMSFRGHAVLDDEGKIIGGVDALRDIQAEHEVRDDLKFFASHDSLTQLLSRAELLTRLDAILSHAPRGGRGLGLLFVDLDRFKDVNDSFGHGVGDQLLIAVAERINDAVRADDLVSRFGGDEIVVALPAIGSVTEVEAVAEKIRQAFAEPISVNDLQIPTSLSIGVAMAEPGDDAGRLLMHADRALYQAKHTGRGNYATYANSVASANPDA